MDKLSKYINEAKAINSEKSPLPEAELRSIMDNCDAKLRNNPKFNIKKGIIMGTTISIIALILMLGSNSMFDANRNENNSKNTNNLQQNIAANYAQSENKQPEIDSNERKINNKSQADDDETEENIINGGSYIMNFDRSNTNDDAPKNAADSLQQILRMIDNKNDNIQIPILRFNKKLGKLLGIKMDGDKFSAKVKSNFYDIEDFWGYDLRKYNYTKPEKHHPGIAKYDYKFSLKDSCNKYKVNILKYDKLQMETESTEESPVAIYRMNIKGENKPDNFKAILSPEWVFRDNLIRELDSVNAFLMSMEKITEIQDSECDSPMILELDTIKYALVKTMFPVIINKTIGDTKSIVIAWYPKDKVLIAKLKKLIKHYTVQEMTPSKSYLVEACFNQRKYLDAWTAKEEKTEPVKMNLPLLNLNKEEMKALGMKEVNDTTYFESQTVYDKSVFADDILMQSYRNQMMNYIHKLGLDTNAEKIIMRTQFKYHSLKNSSSFSSGVSTEQENNLKIDSTLPFAGAIMELDSNMSITKFRYNWMENNFPAFQTKKRKMEVFIDKDSITTNMNRIISISYDYKDWDEKNQRLLLWYIASKELVNKLPERYRAGIMKELSYLDKIEKGEMTLEEACDNLPEESYLNLCAMKSGALTFTKIYPNPAKDVINIEYINHIDGKVRISLVDANGALMQLLQDMKEVNSGMNLFKADISKVQSGLYMIVLESDSGDQIMQKIIIE